MSEGELKKQITDKLQWEFGVDEGHDAYYVFTKILDEAKQEFPLRGTMSEQTPLKNIDRFYEWFKKWFGSGDEK